MVGPIGPRERFMKNDGATRVGGWRYGSMYIDDGVDRENGATGQRHKHKH